MCAANKDALVPDVRTALFHKKKKNIPLAKWKESVMPE